MPQLRYTDKKRIAALGAAVLLILALLLSAAFIAIHSSHECCGEGCRICETAAVCEAVLAGGIAAVSAAAAVRAGYALCASAAKVRECEKRETPVLMKVLMLN